MKLGSPEYKALKIAACKRAAETAVLEMITVHRAVYKDPRGAAKRIEMWLRRGGSNPKKQTNSRAAERAYRLKQKIMREEVYPNVDRP